MIATFEPGLPGTGPLPVHLHTGRPTPWTEGCVVRFTPPSGPSWIGNLQRGHGYATKIVEWPRATAVFVIAKGATYFIRADVPADWRFLDLLGVDCILAPHGEAALLLTYSDVVSISTHGSDLWRRNVAIDGVEITTVENGLIRGMGGIDPPDEWRPFVLHLDTGEDAE